jgi:hypothetical protein
MPGLEMRLGIERTQRSIMMRTERGEGTEAEEVSGKGRENRDSPLVGQEVVRVQYHFMSS